MLTKPSLNTLDHNKQVVRDFFEATHNGNFEVIDTLVAAHIVTHHFPGGHSPTSREEYKAFFRQWSHGVPDQQVSILAMVAEDDFVAVHYSIDGHHNGELFGIPASGRQLSFTGLVLYRMENQQIAETWLYPDSPTLLGTLGCA